MSKVKTDYLLKRLPQDIHVMNCAQCGRLMATSYGVAARYAAAGLRCLGGFLKVKFAGAFIPRPHCIECFTDVSVYHPPGHGRSFAQAQKLRRIGGLA